MKQGMNPFLPLYEYIPDGEPHVFGDRIYLFGSHDREGGRRYCELGNYVLWSAPLAAPTEWVCHGEIYNARKDPRYREGEIMDLYAPDVVQGNDGRFYLYYNLTDSEHGMNGYCSVAAADRAEGPYEYHGTVRHADGTPYNVYLMGDPAVLNDDGVIRLYTGWSLSAVAAEAHAQGGGYEGERRNETAGGQEASGARQAPQMPEPGTPAMAAAIRPALKMLFKKTDEELDALELPLMGANAFELEEDMLTVRSAPRRIVAGQLDTPKDSSFFGHAFYEASSIRKINGRYYFIYSSENSNELCYATSRYPDRDFVYGGTIISNGDVGYQGLPKEKRNNMTANDHGSLENINGQWYIFHHRQTHKSTFSRQACAEKVEILPDGSIPQAECTSMGLNPGPLRAEGRYSAPYSCVLTNGAMPHATNTMVNGDFPYITNEGEERFITDIKEGTKIGYKYFDFDGPVKLGITYKSTAAGVMEVWNGKERLAEIEMKDAEEWTESETEISLAGTHPIFLIYRGEGTARLLEIWFR
ncbi:MAG: glycosyl hydrolase family 43 [Roseburia sp.]|nr:glycosyl hydrolase family 43 [Roseburia sp.]MCM1099395.1 glycosyl hydrolase family 43 [Ruminococcus flavefaciens]